MEAVAEVVADGLSIVGGLVSAYLAIGVGLAFLEGQFDAAMGRPSARDIAGRIVYLTVCVALVAFAQGIKGDIAAIIGGNVDSAKAMRSAYVDIARYFMTIIIGAGSIMLAVGVITGLVGAQLATIAGQALHLSEILARLIMVVGLGVCTVLTLAISNAIIDAIS